MSLGLSVFGRGYLGSQLPGDLWYVSSFPSSPEAEDMYAAGSPHDLLRQVH